MYFNYESKQYLDDDIIYDYVLKCISVEIIDLYVSNINISSTHIALHKIVNIYNKLKYHNMLCNDMDKLIFYVQRLRVQSIY